MSDPQITIPHYLYLFGASSLVSGFILTVWLGPTIFVGLLVPIGLGLIAIAHWMEKPANG
jgi:hypothetical protein